MLIRNLELGYTCSYTLDRDDKMWDETGPAARYTAVLFKDERYAVKSVSFLYYWNYPHFDVAFDKDLELLHAANIGDYSVEWFLLEAGSELSVVRRADGFGYGLREKR